MKVRPATGKIVRDPRDWKPLPAEGRTVPDGSSYWRRRLAAGDVELVVERRGDASASSTAKKEKKGNDR